jgi:hypothetical protein
MLPGACHSRERDAATPAPGLLTLQSGRLQPCKRPRRARIEHVFVAGVPIRDEAVLELARLVDDPDLAGKFETAYGRETKVLALTIPESETILVALDDPPAELAVLQAVLLEEHVARKQTGL